MNTEQLEQLKNYLQKRKANCEKAKVKNFEQNKGISGTCINTTDGKVNDAFLRGKIKIIDDVLEILDKLEKGDKIDDQIKQ